MTASKPTSGDKTAFMIKHGFEPLEPYKNALTKWKCRHVKCGSIVSPRYNDIQQGKGGCKNCGNKKSAESQKFPEEEAVQIMREANLEPLEPYKNNRTKWKCKCLNCGNIVETLFDTIRSGLGGCLTCGYMKTADKQRKDEEFAIEVMLRFNLKPLVAYKSSNTKWKCECLKCGKIVYPTFGAVQSVSKIGCKYCAGNAIDERDAIAIMLASDLEPLEPYKKSHAKWKSKCLKCGKIVYPRLNGISAGQGGCVFCFPAGINQEVPSYLYLITNPELNAHKVGIGNHKKKQTDDRLKKFIRTGWQVFHVWEFETGEKALKIEQRVLSIIRKDMGLPQYLVAGQLPITLGESETVDADEVSLPELKRLINRTIKTHSG
jgi:hypothetical protein